MADFRLGRIKFKWQGDWTAATAYEKDDVVNYNGTSWVCVVNHTSDATDFLDDRDTKWEIMVSGINNAGTWSGSSTYQLNDIAYHNGSTWISVIDNNTNNTPSGASSQWDLFAEGVTELTTQGDILYKGAVTNERLPIGTNNQTLQVSSSGIPEWTSNVDIPGTLGVTGNTTLSGTLNVTSNSTLSGDLAINGGDITSVSTSFNLLNATVTTLNVGGAADVNIGGAAKTVTVGNALDVNGIVYQGVAPQTQATTDGLTGVSAIFVADEDGFSQVSSKNISNDSAASTDFIAYTDNGDNDSGWIDMGITSSTFNDVTYGVTGPNDGYIFMSAPSGTTGNGNLYLSTSGNGQENDIVFSTGGFTAGQEKMRLTDTDHDGFNAGLNIDDDISTAVGKFYVGSTAKSLTVDGTTASTQLDGGINSTATTITVDSTTGFNTKGYITIGDEVIYYGGKTATTFTLCNRGYQGTTAASHLDNAVVEQVTYVGLTNPTAVFQGDADDFVQFAIKNQNSGNSASTDLIAYASDGDNDSGWIDLGITSSTYSDPAFTVTGPGTGYLFFSAPATTIGTGDLLIGTDHTGSNNDIVFFTNGFDAGNERLRIIGQGANAGIEVYADTESTSTTTGALRVEGGIGLQGNLYVGGNVNIIGNITLGGTGNTVETESLAVADPIIRMANGNTASDALDIGFVGTYGSSGAKYTGLVRDASDSKYKLFTGLSTNPTTTVDFTGATLATLSLGTVEATDVVATNFKIGANTVLSGTSLGSTITGSSLTSVGTLTGLTTSGTLAVNAAGGITTDQTTFPLVNTNATTVNFAGAATALNMGAGTGTTTINNDLNLASGKVLKIAGTQVLSGSTLGSGITSSSLTSVGTLSSLTMGGQISVQQIGETLNTKTGATGVVTHDFSTGAIWYHSSISANFTANFTNVPTTADRAYTVSLVLNQGASGYYPNAVQVNSSSVTLRWPDNTAPTPGTNKVDICVFTLIYTGSTWYVVGNYSNYA